MLFTEVTIQYSQSIVIFLLLHECMIEYINFSYLHILALYHLFFLYIFFIPSLLIFVTVLFIK
jgi:hypothetical protein